MSELAVSLAPNGHQPMERPADHLTSSDQGLVWALATSLLDVVPAFSEAVAGFIYDQVPSLPTDDEVYKSMEAVGYAGPLELLTTLRAGMPAGAHETPVEMLAHARYLRSRGLGLRSLITIYQTGFPMFRKVVQSALSERVHDPAQLARIAAAADDYSFQFIATCTTRLAVEFGVHDGGWTPRAGDAVLEAAGVVEAAERFREERIACGGWLPATPEDSIARRQAERELDVFAATIERGVAERDIGGLLSLADTTLTVALADELDLAVTLLLDRGAVEVVDGDVGAEATIWIASVDLQRIWSSDFYLPIAITKGRVRMQGPVRKFLRIVPVLRGLADLHTKVSEEARHA
jgi:hypothetical protein